MDDKKETIRNLSRDSAIIMTAMMMFNLQRWSWEEALEYMVISFAEQNAVLTKRLVDAESRAFPKHPLRVVDGVLQEERYTNWPESTLALIAVSAWVFGIAVAKGFWMVACAIFLPPAAWVLAVRYIIERM